MFLSQNFHIHDWYRLNRTNGARTGNVLLSESSMKRCGQYVFFGILSGPNSLRCQPVASGDWNSLPDPAYPAADEPKATRPILFPIAAVISFLPTLK